MNESELRTYYEKHQQGQVFDYYDKLNDSEKSSLLSQLREIDLNRVFKLFNKASSGDTSVFDIDPLPSSSFSSYDQISSSELLDFEKIGLESISKNQVAVLLLAGGQGTRLGSSAPKGCYDIGLVSKKSLFQLQAERIKKLESLTNGKIKWFIMTSKPTYNQTKKFFEDQNYFGLNPSHVVFFNQGVLPCLTESGKIMMKTNSVVNMAPDGNGGVYKALIDNGILKTMREEGIKYIHCYCVDNSVVKVADPIFMGYCITKKAKCGAKTVEKIDAHESVGIVCVKNNRFGVVEYTEMSTDKANQKDGNKLVFGAANICNHFYSFDFLETLDNADMPCHIAKKKIPIVDSSNPSNSITPKEPNGIKLEIFVFDVFPLLNKSEFAVFMANRKTEFSPLKNSNDAKTDCPKTARESIYYQARKFIIDNGGSIENDENVELSPLISYNGEGIEFVKGKKVKGGYYDSVESLKQNLN